MSDPSAVFDEKRSSGYDKRVRVVIPGYEFLHQTAADVLAQANLDGGGNTDLPRRAKTPLPAMPKATATGEIAVASQRLDALEQEARELMTRINGAATMAPAVPKPVEAPPEPVAVPSASEMMQRTLESMRIEARIAKDIERIVVTLEVLDQELRVLDAKRVATCLGFGPRFLHSTGQAYKGGPNSGVFLQVTCDDAKDSAVPDQKYTFGVVKAAQARGDFAVLNERGRRALRVHLGADVAEGLAKLEAAITSALA
jgi:hypothetical protein